MSFSRLSHKLSQLQAKVGDKVYSALYYGLMPTIIVVGLLKKPRNEAVNHILNMLTGA